MSLSFLHAVSKRAQDVQRTMDDIMYQRMAESMVIDGDAEVMAAVLREMAEEGGWDARTWSRDNGCPWAVDIPGDD